MRRLFGGVRGGVSSGGVLLVAVERVGSGERFWGPFGDIDEVIRFCEAGSLVVTVVPLVDPGVVGAV